MGSLAGAKVGHRMPKLLCPEGTADWAVRHAERTTRFWASRSSRSNLTAHYHMMMRAPAYRDHRQKAAFIQVIGGSVYVHVVHADDFTRNVVRFILIMFEKLWRVRAPRTRAPACAREREGGGGGSRTRERRSHARSRADRSRTRRSSSRATPASASTRSPSTTRHCTRRQCACPPHCWAVVTRDRERAAPSQVHRVPAAELRPGDLHPAAVQDLPRPQARELWQRLAHAVVAQEARRALPRCPLDAQPPRAPPPLEWSAPRRVETHSRLASHVAPRADLGPTLQVRALSMCNAHSSPMARCTKIGTSGSRARRPSGCRARASAAPTSTASIWRSSRRTDTSSSPMASAVPTV